MNRFAIRYRKDRYVTLGPRPFKHGFSTAPRIEDAYQCSETTARLTVDQLAKDYARDDFQIVPVTREGSLTGGQHG